MKKSFLRKNFLYIVMIGFALIFIILYKPLKETFQNPIWRFTDISNALQLEVNIAPLTCPYNYTLPFISNTTASYTINTTNVRSIPNRALGFSVEFNSAHKIFSYKNGNVRDAFVTLMNLLKSTQNSSVGPNIRISGSSSEYSRMNQLTDAQMNTYRFINNFNGSLTMSVSLKLNEPAYYAEFIRKIKNIVSDNTLELVEIGNEPELIIPFNSYDEYETRLLSYINALKPVVQNKLTIGGFVLLGKVGDKKITFFNNLISNINTFKNDVKVINVHDYAYHECDYKDDKLNSKNPNTIYTLLDKSYHFNISTRISTISDNSDTKVLVHISEFNTVACRGQWNVSDTFASALYVIDYVLYQLYTGIKRLNLHVHPVSDGLYTPFQFGDIYKSNGSETDIRIKPTFYGYWLLYYATRNNATLCKPIEKPTINNQIRIWTLQNSNEFNIVILSMKRSGHKKIRINKLPTTNKTANSLRLICKNGISGKDGIFLGNLTLDGTTDGVPRKCFSNNVQSNNTFTFGTVPLINDSYYEVIVPELTALVLTIPK